MSQATQLQQSATTAKRKAGAALSLRTPHAVKRAMALSAVMGLAGCAYDDIDHLYAEAVRFQAEISDFDVNEGPRLYPDLITKGDYDAGAGKYTSVKSRRVIGRRKMEKDLVLLLQVRCPTETYSCAIAELERLDFECVERSGRAECISERRTSNPKTPNPLKGSPEHQLWTVLLERQANGARMQARLQFLGPHYD